MPRVVTYDPRVIPASRRRRNAVGWGRYPTDVDTNDPVREARLLVEWLRGAAGRYAWSDETDAAAPRAPTPAGRPTAAGAGGAAGTSRAPVGAGVGGAAPVAPVPAAAAERDAAALSGPTTPSEGPDPFDALRADAAQCRRCRLCETRSTVVFGEGPRRPRLLVVGEAPGADEDATGRPFVGKAGQLLTKMLGAIGLAREDVYIANVLKCRPPDNRPPEPDEVAACRPFLDEQIRLLDPELVLALGNPAAKALLGTDRGITSIRGQLRTLADGRRVLPSFHPSYLLRTPEAKRESWLDLQLVARTLGLSLPSRPSADERDE